MKFLYAAKMAPEIVNPLTQAILRHLWHAGVPRQGGPVQRAAQAPDAAAAGAVLADEYRQFAMLVKASGYKPE